MSLSLKKSFTIMVGLVVIGLTACAYQPPSPPARPATVKPRKPSQLFELSAGEFQGLGVAEQRVDSRRMDQTLLAATLFHEANVRRQQAGRSPLRHDARLDRAALLHAVSMVRDQFFDHVNPGRADLRTPKERVLSVGFNPMFISENIATHFDIHYQSGAPLYRVPRENGGGFSTTPDGPPIAHHTYRSFAVSLMDEWMASEGHRQNILSKYPIQSGAGCAISPTSSGMGKLCCVQLFGVAME